jgi:hypothetical protein
VDTEESGASRPGVAVVNLPLQWKETLHQRKLSDRVMNSEGIGGNLMLIKGIALQHGEPDVPRNTIQR